MVYRVMCAVLLCASALSAPQGPDGATQTPPPGSDSPQTATTGEPGRGGEYTRRARQDSVTEPPEVEVATDVQRFTSPAATLASAAVRTFQRRPRPGPAAPAPRLVSKLSYYGQDEEEDEAVATNFLGLSERERKDRRHFTTTCRCEKIWNCPKLQITTPRCPNEYFLCCSL